MIIIKFSSTMARPEKDDQKYLNTAQSWVSKVFIRGTSSKESRAAVCLLRDSGELRVFSEENIYLQINIIIHPLIYLEREIFRPRERDIKAPDLQSDL